MKKESGNVTLRIVNQTIRRVTLPDLLGPMFLRRRAQVRRARRLVLLVLSGLFVVGGWSAGRNCLIAARPVSEDTAAESSAVGAGSTEMASLLIQADELHVGDGQVLRPGMVWVADGKIRAVGAELAVPEGTEVRRVAALTPGFVDAAASVGIAGGAGEVTSEVTPEFVVSEAIDLLDAEFARQVDRGITTVHVTPSTENVFAGFGGVLKTAGQGEGRWLQKQSGLCLSMCNDPTSRNASRGRPETLYMRQPTNRMGVVWILRSRLHSAGQESPASVPGVNLEVINPLLADMVAGRTPAYAVSRTSYDIETLYRIGDEFGFVPVLVGGDESYKVIDLLKQKQAQVVFTALSTGSIGAERSELRWSTPLVLSQAGVEFALAGDRLLEQARFARRYGLSSEESLAAITGRPAKILGIADRVGQIAVGLAADLVAFSGDPLQVTSTIEWVMIDGQVHANGEDR